MQQREESSHVEWKGRDKGKLVQKQKQAGHGHERGMCQDCIKNVGVDSWSCTAGYGTPGVLFTAPAFSTTTKERPHGLSRLNSHYGCHGFLFYKVVSSILTSLVMLYRRLRLHPLIVSAWDNSQTAPFGFATSPCRKARASFTLGALRNQTTFINITKVRSKPGNKSKVSWFNICILSVCVCWGPCCRQ